MEPKRKLKRFSLPIVAELLINKEKLMRLSSAYLILCLFASNRAKVPKLFRDKATCEH